MADIARKNVVNDDLRREATERSDCFIGKRKIYVCGGRDDGFYLKSVESFSLPENAWTPEPAMNVPRAAPAAFVYHAGTNHCNWRMEWRGAC